MILLTLRLSQAAEQSEPRKDQSSTSRALTAQIRWTPVFWRRNNPIGTVPSQCDAINPAWWWDTEWIEQGSSRDKWGCLMWVLYCGAGSHATFIEEADRHAWACDVFRQNGTRADCKTSWMPGSYWSEANGSKGSASTFHPFGPISIWSLNPSVIKLHT